MIRAFKSHCHLFFSVLLLLSLSGCRREDIREMTIEMPALVETNRVEIVKVLSRYDGILTDSFVWDMRARTLTLKYDSMKIAQSNIRYAIDEKGIEVQFPVKVDNHAGY